MRTYNTPTRKRRANKKGEERRTHKKGADQRRPIA